MSSSRSNTFLQSFLPPSLSYFVDEKHAKPDGSGAPIRTVTLTPRTTVVVEVVAAHTQCVLPLLRALLSCRCTIGRR